jgi:AcrR family transcriptional regulator
VTQLRADAQRNLDRVIEAASECFAESGLEVSVDEIATRAGVGHGTVFRRFPTKDALLEAVLARELGALAKAAEAGLADPDPWAGFEQFFRAAAAGYARNRALVEGGFERCVTPSEKVRLVETAGRLVRKAQQAGVVRRELSVEDVFDLIPAASRHPDVIVAGLRLS